MHSATWFGQILALFYVYSLGVWAIHHFEPETGWKSAGAWLFCVVVSSLVEGIVLFVRSRRTGTAAAPA